MPLLTTLTFDRLHVKRYVFRPVGTLLNNIKIGHHFIKKVFQELSLLLRTGTWEYDFRTLLEKCSPDQFSKSKTDDFRAVSWPKPDFIPTWGKLIDDKENMPTNTW